MFQTNDSISPIRRAGPGDAETIATLVGELLTEIMQTTRVAAFEFNQAATQNRARDLLERELYVVFIARHPKTTAETGFISLCETHALYAEGAFGIIPELFVRPAYRSFGTGAALLDAARHYGQTRGWKRLEVTTPPLPDFQRTMRFYETRGFSVSGGRKMRRLL